VVGTTEPQPFFSIGVTTYNRRELLQQTFASLIGQTCQDFEVIVGNDYVKETLSADMFGLDERKFRFVNNRENVGEVRNMNLLLGQSRGRYFRWLADDDLCAPDLLEAVRKTLERFNFPKCVFSGYAVITHIAMPNLKKTFSGEAWLLSGREFLRKHLSGEILSIVPYGFYETTYLREMGGVETVCEAPVGMYGETMLLLKTGFLDQVALITDPLDIFRTHAESWVRASKDSDYFREAGHNLIRKSIGLLAKPELRDDFRENLANVMKMAFSYFLLKTAWPVYFSTPFKILSYLRGVPGLLKELKGTDLYVPAIISFYVSIPLALWDGFKYLGSLAIARLRLLLGFKAANP